MEDFKKGLAIPMYGLHYIDSIDDVEYDTHSVFLFKRDYSTEKRKRIFLSLEWAMNNESTDFKNIKPYSSDRFTNDEIFKYLKNLYLFMKENDLDR